MNDDERQARIDAIRRTHVPETDSDVMDVDFGPVIEIGPSCAECGDEWPCEQGLLLAELDAATARSERAEAALARGRRFIARTIEAVTPSCPCTPYEFCGECLAIKTLEQARAALAEGA